MTNVATKKQVKAFEKFNADLQKFADETGEVFVTLYEDANTTREVNNFKLYLNGKLKYVELDWVWENGNRVQRSKQEVEVYDFEDEIDDTLKFWKACLRRAKKYWSMDADKLDRIQEGEEEDIELED